MAVYSAFLRFFSRCAIALFLLVSCRGETVLDTASKKSGDQLTGATQSPSEKSGDRLMLAGRYREAAELYELALGEQISSPELQRKLAEAYAKNDKLPASISAYEQAIQLQPDFAKARTELAIIFTRLDRYDDAFAMLEKAVQD